MSFPIAFRKYPGVEYVMDYILERKRVDDLHQSIKDRRYDKQKYNMQRCGLRHLIYLVEGDPDTLGDETGGCCNTHYILGILPLALLTTNIHAFKLWLMTLHQIQQCTLATTEASCCAVYAYASYRCAHQN